MTLDNYILSGFQLDNQTLKHINCVNIEHLVNELKSRSIIKAQLALVHKNTGQNYGISLFNFDGTQFYKSHKNISINMLKAITFNRTVVKKQITKRDVKCASIPLFSNNKIYGILEVEVHSKNALSDIQHLEKSIN